MSACCRSSPDLTLPHDDLLRRLRRRPIDGLSSAVIRLRPPAVGPVGGLFVAEAVFPRGSRCKWARSSQVRDRVISAARLNAVGERIGDLEGDVIPVLAAEAGEERRRSEVVAAAAMTAVLGTGNRVLYKLALVPLKQYPFFLAQLATIGYVIVYFSILYGRYRAGIVTDEMLSMPKTPFMAVGLLEALGAASGMAAGEIVCLQVVPKHIRSKHQVYEPFLEMFVEEHYRRLAIQHHISPTYQWIDGSREPKFLEFAAKLCH